MSEHNPYAPPTTNLNPPPPPNAPALWNPDAAGAWSLLFTPIFGSVLLWKNWQAIGNSEKSRAGLIWLIVSVFMILPTLFLRAFGLIYIIVWYFAWQRPQSKYVAQQWGKNYPRKSWQMPLGIGCGVWLVFFLGSVVIIALVASMNT